jgi:AraC-like DNA-binding protein
MFRERFLGRPMPARLQKTAKAEVFEKHAPARGLLDLAHAEQNFSLHRYYPSAKLAPFVEHFWIIHWDLRGQPAYTSEVLPYPSVNITFTYERGWVTGVPTDKYTYRLDGRGSVLGIKFWPGAFRAILGRGVDTITDKTLPVTDIFPQAGDAFRARLLAHGTDANIVADAEAMLGAPLPAPDPNVPLINEIVALVEAGRELTSVAAIAKRFGMPQRTLQHLFKTHVGVGLKWIIRRYRLMEAAQLAEAGTDQNWTEIAHRLGYADQAHFTNDFTRMIGRPPTGHAKYVTRE